MQEMQANLFRKVALERLSSPEQLDMLMRVITPKAWLALGPLLGLIFLALVWSWFGSIPTKVNGSCILINPTGLADVSSIASGRITSLLVKVGDEVKAGQEVARVAQPEMLDRIDKAKQRLAELQAHGRVVRSMSSQGEVLNTQSLAQQRIALESRLRVQLEMARLAAEREDTQSKLLEQGLVTRQAVVQTKQERAGALLEAENIKNQIKELSLRRLQGEKQDRGEVANIEAQINEAQRELDSLQENGKLNTSITSPFSGRVVDVKVGAGSLVAPGSSLFNVERTGAGADQLEAVLFVPAADGKKVAPGMIAEITPSTVKREEYGFMRGKVNFVSDYPATQQSMMLLLQNDALVRDLSGESAPIEIRAKFASTENYSGYEWSSASGAPVKIHSGTLCTGDIVVQRQRPISLVIPIIKKTLGVD
jgi:HlyD family secretion protein